MIDPADIAGLEAAVNKYQVSLCSHIISLGVENKRVVYA